LSKVRNNIVFGVGGAVVDLVVIGEAPGREEDLRGEPFVGEAGQMLDKMVENVLRLKRSEIYILNVLKCRPPENRDPEPAEIDACRPFLDAQLDILRPKVILALGRYATQVLLRTTQGIRALRGRWQIHKGIPVMPTYHPAYLLRNPSEKRDTFEDLLVLKKRLDEIRRV